MPRRSGGGGKSFTFNLGLSSLLCAVIYVVSYISSESVIEVLCGRQK